MDLFRFAATRRVFHAAAWLCAGQMIHAVPVAFDLPAQPAPSAIVEFAKQAGAEVLFASRDLATVRSTAVVGSYEPDTALARLLEGTGFVVARNAAGKYAIVRAPKHVGQIRGTVVSEADGTPVPGALVRLDGAVMARRVGADGRFGFEDVPAAPQALIVHADGYRTMRVTAIQVQPGRPSDLGKIRLVPGVDDPQQLNELVVNASDLGADSGIVSLQAVVVTPSRYLLTEERGTVAATLTESDLLALPQLGEDLYRAISHLPGLVADDFTAKFWVRGAPHEKVLARLDGVDLLEPFHLKDVDSTLSILDLETISRMDLYTGGFTAEYGDRLAGVLTMETDRYVRAKPRTTIALSLTGVRAATRGSAKNQHWLVSARSGYPALALEITDGSNVIKPHYYDLYGKWEFDLTPQHSLSVHALHAGDTMEFRDATGPIVNSRYGSDYLWARWRATFSERLEAETVASATQLDWHRLGSGTRNLFYPLALKDDRELRSIALRQDWTARLSERVMARGGFETGSGSAKYDYASMHQEPVVMNGTVTTQAFERTEHAAPDGTSAAGYGTLRVQPLKPLTIEAGLRYGRDNYAADSNLSPRLNVAFTQGRTTVRAAWGEYTQAQGLHELSIGDGERAFSRAEKAEHRIISLERRLKSGVNLRLEGYERIVTHPRTHWENVVDALDILGELSYDRMQIDPVRQRARGVEFIAEQRANPRFTWSATYALAQSEETLRSGRTVPRARDQRHTIYLDASYTPNARWQFSAAWQYHTGWPATPVAFTVTPLTNGGAAVFGDPGTLYSTRLPVYHRLDFRIQRRLQLKHGELRLYLDAFNAYSRRNSIGYRYTVTVQGSEITQIVRENDHNLFPILPSFGAVWDF